MKRLVFVILFSSVFGFSQYVVKDGGELLKLRKVPQEKIYLHHSAPIVFSGEYLYYKIYCQNAQTNRLGRISTVAYVALVNNAGNEVFQHKIKLDKGMGSGDFFVDTTVPSGNYKLVAYTQWMKNNGLNQLFQDDVTIVNPYLADQSALRHTSGTPAEASLPNDLATTSGEELMELQFANDTYGKRDKVTFTLRNYKGNLGHGNYSILIRKKDGLGSRTNLSAASYATRYLTAGKQLQQGVGDSIFLPEQRGELFYGQVVDTKGGVPAKDKTVIVSVPGKEHLLKNAITDDSGHFYTYIRKDYKNPQSIVQVLEEGNYTINLKKQPQLDYAGLTFSNFYLDKGMQKTIQQRSVHNQIENAFFSVKPDSILPKEAIDVFDGGEPEIFELDDYTRFRTLEETFVEVFNRVGYRNEGKGNEYIRVAQVFEKFNEPYNDYKAIVLIDGVFIPDHSKIKDFDARKIKYIKVLSDVLAIGSMPYQGLVAIETFDGDFYETYTNENTISSALELPKPRKNYFRQRFEAAAPQTTQIPDYRYILLWEPFVDLESEEAQFDFYTSDVAGEYEIFLEGFTSYGKPVSLRKTLIVE